MMIRFINLTSQILIDDDELHFAWFDTVIDEFMTFNSSQEWHTWNEFVDDLTIYLKEHRAKGSPPIDDKFHEKRNAEILERFRRLYQFDKAVRSRPTNSDPSSKE